MDKIEILATANTVFIVVLDNPQIILTDTTTAGEIAEWDSLSHIQLVVALEKKFRIRFSSREIRGWKNVGELVDSINAKVNPTSAKADSTGDKIDQQ